jgi:hypothetical protein
MTDNIVSIDAGKPKTITVTDARQRKITLKKPSALAQYRIVEVAGDAAANGTYMSMVLPLIFVVAIDDDPVLQPTSKLQLEALITRLDEDGISAVMQGVASEFGAAVAA